MTTPTFRIGRFVWLLLGALIVGFVLYQLRSALLPFHRRRCTGLHPKSAGLVA